MSFYLDSIPAYFCFVSLSLYCSIVFNGLMFPYIFTFAVDLYINMLCASVFLV